MDKKVLLIADDDEMNRMIIRKFLKNDYDIMEACDGKETLDILKSKHIDAILLDIIMPEMDGLEVLSTMKEEPNLRRIGVLVATSTKEKTERESLALGADDVVAKPYDPVVIKKRLQNILAVKAIEMEQELQKNANTEEIANIKIHENSVQMEQSIHKIVKFTEIVRANKSNYKLVDEILEEIRLEADKALETINAKD